jgi:hypothetical protein
MRLKKVFFDTEFTRIGQNTTLVSIGFISESAETLYIELSDYDRTQVTPWLETHVMRLLHRTETVTTAQARDRVAQWFEAIHPQGKIQLISAGKDIDNILLYNLWAEVQPGSTLKTWRDRLPAAIDHKWHLDMDTAFALFGVDPNQERAALVESPVEGEAHHALYDARMIKACWEKYIAPKVNSLYDRI